MDASQIAKEIEANLVTGATVMIEAIGANPLSTKDILTLCRDRAASLSIAFEGRLLPVNSCTLEPDEMLPQVEMTLDEIRGAVIDCPERYHGVSQLKETTIELIGLCAMTGDHRFARCVAVLYATLELCNSMKAAYENADPNQIVNDMLARH